MEKYPAPLAEYIEQQIRSERTSNNADGRTTPQSRLNEISAECKMLYERGQALMKSIGEEDLARCRRFFNTKFEYGADTLTRRYIMKKDVIVPQYVTLYERMRIIRAAIL